MPVSTYRCLAAWVVIAFACQASFAQVTDDWAAVQGMNPGTTVSVKTRNGKKYHGEFVSASTILLSFDSDERGFPGRTIRRRMFPREEVKEVRMLATMKSVLAGGAIGAGVGIGLGAGLESTAKSKEDNRVLPVVFGLLGLAIGMGIAKSHPFWQGKKIYVSP